jgi:hypothetical protein
VVQQASMDSSLGNACIMRLIDGKIGDASFEQSQPSFLPQRNWGKWLHEWQLVNPATAFFYREQLSYGSSFSKKILAEWA